MKIQQSELNIFPVPTGLVAADILMFNMLKF